MKVILNILTCIIVIMLLFLPLVGLLAGIIADKGDTKLALSIVFIYGGVAIIITIIQGIGWKKFGEDKK